MRFFSPRDLAGVGVSNRRNLGTEAGSIPLDEVSAGVGIVDCRSWLWQQGDDLFVLVG
jgi:hypothetical protein